MIIKSNKYQDIVLIVEDTLANHDVIRTFLSDMGISCESAFDGMEAVTKCSSVARDHYSLILMDLNLPHMDGSQTAKALRNLGITTPIITITATDKNDPRLCDARDVFNGVLFKPFNASDFFSAVLPYMKNISYSAFEDICHAKGSLSLFPGDTGSTSDIYGCNIDKGIHNLGSNRKLFIKHFNNFKANNADLALRLNDMIRASSYEDAAFLCHSIKGLSGMLGMDSLQHHMAELERLLKIETNGFTDSEAAADEHVPDSITRQLAAISNALRKICQIHVDYLL